MHVGQGDRCASGRSAFAADAGSPPSREKPNWRSGGRLWVVDVIAPFGGHEAMLNDLKTQVFQGRTIKCRAVVDGQPGVREI